jgi:hypothetical protein
MKHLDIANDLMERGQLHEAERQRIMLSNNAEICPVEAIVTPNEEINGSQISESKFHGHAKQALIQISDSETSFRGWLANVKVNENLSLLLQRLTPLCNDSATENNIRRDPDFRTIAKSGKYFIRPRKFPYQVAGKYRPWES